MKEGIEIFKDKEFKIITINIYGTPPKDITQAVAKALADFIERTGTTLK